MTMADNTERDGSSVKYTVLMSAYACEPGAGSEPGVGWYAACTMAEHHRVVVLTNTFYRAAIEAELKARPRPNLSFVYYRLDALPRWFRRSSKLIHVQYALWQFGAYRVAKALLRTHKFDLAHHITFGCYWQPSLLAFLPLPYVWGPVGGGEAAPTSFWPQLGATGVVKEALRNFAQWCGEQNPFVRLTARRCAVGVTSTPESAARLRKLGVRQLHMVSGQTAVTRADLALLDGVSDPPDAPVRFISLGRLLHWKGIHLGLRAFAEANIPGAEYWIVGEGPDQPRLERLAKRLKIDDRVVFWGRLSRDETLAKLRACHALVHPSLHDWSPTVCVEAMAAGRPVICLDLGGPAQQITDQTGIRASAENPRRAVREVAAAMVRLAEEPSTRAAMGAAGRRRVQEYFLWEDRAEEYSRCYRSVVAPGPDPRRIAATSDPRPSVLAGAARHTVGG
jgi:glycosyltransferase involved in cell wall biosynthesis